MDIDIKGGMRFTARYGETIPKEFYSRPPDRVAPELLGALLVRRMGNRVLGGMITEVEAYFGPEDPASRASKKGSIGRAMYREPGRTLIYMVHNNWLLNIVTTAGGPGAVLIRSVEPLIGVEEMFRRRGVSRKRLLTTGPGRLTKALGITRELDDMPVYIRGGELELLYYLEPGSGEVGRSGRIGVSRDLEEPYRYYLLSSDYVSR